MSESRNFHLFTAPLPQGKTFVKHNDPDLYWEYKGLVKGGAIATVAQKEAAVRSGLPAGSWMFLAPDYAASGDESRFFQIKEELRRHADIHARSVTER